MDTEQSIKALRVSAILFKYNVPVAKAKIISTFIEELIQENQELKKQLKNCYCNRTDCSARIKDSKQYDSLAQKVEKQQKEFIEWLDSMLVSELGVFTEVKICDVLSKYKEIIGDKE